MLSSASTLVEDVRSLVIRPECLVPARDADAARRSFAISFWTVTRVFLDFSSAFPKTLEARLCIQAGRLGNNKGMRSAAKSLNSRTGLAM